jgi:hypothetical protein
MRGYVDRSKLERFMEVLGQRATTPGVVYLVGGSTALLLGIREQTIDIDIKLDPEPEGAFRAIAELKELLSVNVELASPDHFLPPLPGWRERSQFVAAHGKVVFRHYDFYSQVLAKVARGHARDVSDAESLMQIANLTTEELARLAAAIEPEIERYPAVDISDLRARLASFIDSVTRS